MPLKFYATQAEVPEETRESSIALADGRFAVLEEPAPAELGADGKAALEAERTARRAAEKAKRDAEAERDRLKREHDARARGVTEEELQRIRDDEALARKPIEEERDRLAQENRRLKHTDRVRALALKHGVMADRIDDAMLSLEGRTDLDENGGIVVKGKDGKATAESIDDFLLKTFKAEKPWYYKGTGASGSGSAGSDGGGGNPPPPAAPERDQQRRAAVIAGF